MLLVGMSCRRVTALRNEEDQAFHPIQKAPMVDRTESRSLAGQINDGIAVENLEARKRLEGLMFLKINWSLLTVHVVSKALNAFES
ncbi:hypothetical protein PsorP6_012166 [Peronosclerospora sorghi]|uniref:Uncharacterized protein n=1 Tax=Peronosclerospora sorghi TaxID=230839 RepID=A0ACC0WKI0_9STRA|nr:hypothetical protein PsorP6_012166 [Peronosclerospora sorghi]